MEMTLPTNCARKESQSGRRRALYYKATTRNIEGSIFPGSIRAGWIRGGTVDGGA